MPDENTAAGPYGDQALRYHSAGWSPLPLPARAKKYPPEGWTGAQGRWPSGADVYAWTEDNPTGNIALRLPPNVIGVDVDHYGGKPGGAVLHSLEAELGELPSTWRSTSRDDGVSGIRFYTVPEGLRWPSVLGPGIEVIRHGHRYAVAWPSIHPDTGGTYRWVTPDGTSAIGDIPDPDSLPPLPHAWVEHFTGGEAATDQPRAGLSGAAIGDWLTRHGAGPECGVTKHALGRLLSDLTTATSRHDAALTGTNRIVWTAGLGHTGAASALATARQAFLGALGNDRTPGEAAAEWDRLIAGAVDLAAASHPNPGADPCTDQLAHLIPPGTRTTTPAATPSGVGPTTSTTATSSSAATAATSPTESTSTTSSSPEPDELERTTWWPRDGDAALDDDNPEPGPAFLVRDDGHALFYPGRVNGIVAPSESGKTWVALLGVVQAVNAEQRVTFLDFEDSHRGITGRLRALGLTKAQIRAHVAYIGPDEPFHPFLPTGRDLREHLASWQPYLIVLDGFNAAMTLQGLDLMSNKDATVFAQSILKPLAVDGACVVYIDHTPKDTENKSSGGIGAQAKRAMTTGCAIKVEVIKAFGKGQEGKLRLRVDKDRQGDVRGISLPGKAGHWAGDVTISSSADSDAVEVTLHAPDGVGVAPAERPPFRPTGLMDKVCAYIRAHPGVGVREIREGGVSGRKEYVAKALDLLVDEGWVTVSEGSRGKHEHHVAEDFNELLQPPNDRAPDRAPTVPPGHGQTTVPPCPPVQDVVLPERGTVRGRPDATTADRAPGARSRVVERVIGGKRVNFNLDTGEVTHE